MPALFSLAGSGSRAADGLLWSPFAGSQVSAGRGEGGDGQGSIQEGTKGGGGYGGQEERDKPEKVRVPAGVGWGLHALGVLSRDEETATGFHLPRAVRCNAEWAAANRSFPLQAPEQDSFGAGTPGG